MKTLVQAPDEARAVRMLRALANPVRYRIVALLAARRSCVCGELVEALPLAQSTVSEHLAVLKEAGIVQGTIEGPNTCYCLDPEALRFLAGRIVGLVSETACGGEDTAPTGKCC